MLIAESPRWNARYDIGIVDYTPSTVTPYCYRRLLRTSYCLLEVRRNSRLYPVPSLLQITQWPPVLPSPHKGSARPTRPGDTRPYSPQRRRQGPTYSSLRCESRCETTYPTQRLHGRNQRIPENHGVCPVEYRDRAPKPRWASARVRLGYPARQHPRLECDMTID